MSIFDSHLSNAPSINNIRTGRRVGFYNVVFEATTHISRHPACPMNFFFILQKHKAKFFSSIIWYELFKRNIPINPTNIKWWVFYDTSLVGCLAVRERSAYLHEGRIVFNPAPLSPCCLLQMHRMPAVDILSSVICTPNRNIWRMHYLSIMRDL